MGKWEWYRSIENVWIKKFQKSEFVRLGWDLVFQQLQAPTHVRPVWPFASFQWLKCWQLSNQPISGQSAHNIKLFGILIFSSAMIVVSAIQFLDVTKTESGTSVDREIYWVTYLLGKCLGRCSLFFHLKYVVNIVRYIVNIVRYCEYYEI